MTLNTYNPPSLTDIDVEIDKLEGAELNRIVAMALFDWTPIAAKFVQDDYAGDIKAAWKVVERMGTMGFWAEIQSPFWNEHTKMPVRHDAMQNPPQWSCGFTPHLTSGWNGVPDCNTNAETAPLAICRSALKKLVELCS